MTSESMPAAMNVAKPVPRPAPESKPFWAAAARHRLEVQYCSACSKPWFPPSLYCPHCLSAEHAWREVSGRGSVFSFVIFDRVYHPAFAGDVPYAVALVELEEGPRMITNILGIPPEDVRCDMPVEVVFKTVSDELSIPCFRPRGGSG
jgi:uncharacterized OB-fold protein